ncbi:hypothetical protein J6590_071795 [Homalodisca vitripennis]|nr:hypothetical protein J6590_071795 [Homalodisca vitripennis]
MRHTKILIYSSIGKTLSRKGYRRPEGEPRGGEPFQETTGVELPSNGQNFLKTEESVSLSEQNLADCTRNEGNFGCYGGWPENSFKYVKINNGIDTEASYPYEDKRKPFKTENDCRYNPKNVGATYVGYVSLPKGNETSLETAVATVGPISVLIDASFTTFHQYKRGVYRTKGCSTVDLDHVVLVVGYDKAKKGGDYWLINNSCEMDWGRKGYMMIAMNHNNICGIATGASYPLV